MNFTRNILKRMDQQNGSTYSGPNKQQYLANRNVYRSKAGAAPKILLSHEGFTKFDYVIAEIDDETIASAVLTDGEWNLPFEEFVVEYESTVAPEATIGKEHIFRGSHTVGTSVHVQRHPDGRLAVLEYAINNNAVLYFGLNQMLYNADEKSIQAASQESQTGVWRVLNALYLMTCNNIEARKTVIGKRPKKGNKMALAFDDYYTLELFKTNSAARETLVVPGESRTVRQHLRRGHVRHYPQGFTRYINSVIVNPDEKHKVHKDYAL